jgi:hypothetical protein
MLDSIKIYLPLLLSMFLVVNTYELQNHFLISAKLNGTSPSITFDQLKPNQIYLNFLFDFEYHNKHVTDSKNVAYFKISTNLNIPTGEELTKDSIAYRFSQKKWTQIKNNKIANNIMYKKVPVLIKEKKGDTYNYYFKIEKSNDKKITLIIRAPTQGKKEGFLNIENILELPSVPKLRNLVSTENKINEDKNKNKINNNNNRRNNNNRHRNIFNNNKRTYYNTGSRYKRRNKFVKIFNLIIAGKFIRSLDGYVYLLMETKYFSPIKVILAIIWCFIFVLFFLQNKRKNNQLIMSSKNLIEMENFNKNYIRLS